MSRFGSAPLRALTFSIFLSIPIHLAASTAQIQTYFDTDNNPATGCSVTFGSEAINGVEQVLTTSIEITSTSSTVTGVTRSLCDGSVFGSPLSVDTTGWPIGTEGASGISHIETHIPLSAFGGSLPAVQRVYFVGTTGGFHSSLFTSASGAAILYPDSPGRRRAVGQADPRSIVLDGETGDWNGIKPLVSGGANGGITAIAFQSISAFAGSSDLFFLFDTKLNLTAPIAIDDSYDGSQGRSLNVSTPGVLTNDISPTGAALSALLVSPPEHGTVTLAPSGGFSYVNDGATAPVDHFTYKANDGTADSNTATVTINVEADGAPVARPDSYSVPHAGTLTVPRPGVLGNDSDPDGDRLTVSVQTNPQHGTLTLNPDGSFTYTHDGSNTTTDSFRYRASDGVRTGSAIVTIAIGPDVPPVAVNDTYAVNEGGTLTVPAPGVLGNDTDADSPRTLWTASLVSGPANGTLTLNADGSFAYVHNGSETTFDSFTYVLNDGIVNSAPATVTITIAPVNDAPVATADSHTTNEDTLLNVLAPGVLANDTDPDSALTAILVANASNGTVTLNPNGSFAYAPNPNFNGTDSFTYKANDGLADSNTVTVTITVTAVNDAPAITVPGAQATNEDAPLGFTTISIADVDAGAGVLQLTLTSVNGTLALGSTTGLTVSGNGTASVTVTGTLADLNAALNGLTFTPAADYSGPASVSLTINDQGNSGAGGPLSDTQTINITVNPVNDPPVVNAATFSLPENSANGTAVGSVTFTDVESATETYAFAITAGNTNNAFAINPATGAITVNNSAALDFETSPTFSLTVQVTDDGTPVANGSATITVTLTDVNEAPVVSPATFAIDENSANGTAAGSVTAIDQDAGQTLTYAITAGNTGGAFAVNPTTGAITVASSAALDFETNPTFSLTVQVTDNGAPVLSGTATITINLNDVNEGPVVNPATFALPENSPNGTAVGTITFADPDAGQTHTFAISAGNTGGAFTIDSVTGAITVANVTAVDFETNPVFNLTVTVTDNGTPILSGSAAVTINLSDVNDAPSIANQSFSVPENSANGVAVGTVVASDQDAGQTLTYAITAGDPSGVFAINPSTGAITVANSALLNFEATPSFSLTVQVTDNAGAPLSSSATVTVNVIDVNEAPVVNPATFAVDENSANGTAVGTVTFADPDGGQTHTFAITGGNTNGAFAIDNSGNITVANAAALDFETTPSFTLTVLVTDNGVPALSGSAFVTINLNNVNEAPVNTVPGAQTTAEDTPLLFNATNGNAISISDPDAGGASVEVTIAVTNGVVSLGTTAGLSFSVGSGSGPNMTFTGTIAAINTAFDNMVFGPTFDYNGPASIVITTNDLGNTGSGTNQTDSDTINITVTPVNDAPVANFDTYTVDGGATLTVPAPGVLSNDTDPDLPPQTLTAVLETGPTHASSFTLNADGSFTYVNDGLGANSDSFTYHAFDGIDAGSPNTVSITVQYNDPPQVNPATFSIAENTANGTNVGTPITFTDAESATETYTFAITGGNTGGAFAINSTTGQITVANSTALDFETNPSFSLTVQVTDNGSPVRSGTATVTVNLTNVNEAPVVNPATVSIAENTANGTAVTTATFTDQDAGQTHTFAITAGNTGTAFAIDPSTGVITVLDSTQVNFESTPMFNLTVQVTDNGAPILSGTATVTINLTDVNEAPAPTGSFSVAENSANGTIVGTVAANDPDTGQTETFSITGGSGAGAFTINANTGEITVADSTQLNFEVSSSLTLTVLVTDNGSPVQSGSGTITITVTDVNEAPVVNDQTFTIDENLANGSTVGTLAFTDPDAGQTHTWVISSGNTGGAFAIDNTGKITVATSAAVNFETSPVFTLNVQVTDNGSPNLSDTAVVTINLNDLNEAPTAIPHSYAATGNTQLRVFGAVGSGLVATTDSTSLQTGATDPDNNAAYNVVSVVPATGTSANGGNFAIASDGSFSYTPPAGFTGSDSFTYQVVDNGSPALASTPATVSVTVSNMVWYIRDVVDGQNPAGGDGRSTDAFDTLTQFNAATTNNGDIIFVYAGNTATTSLTGSITLKDGQKLWGEAYGLNVNSVQLVAAGAVQPRIFNNAGDAVSIPATAGNRTSVEVRGVDLQASGSGVFVNATGGNTISVTITGNTIRLAGVAPNAGIRVSHGSSSTISSAVIQNNTSLNSGGNAIDVRTSAGLLTADVSFNTNLISSAANGISLDGSAGGTLYVTHFESNTISGVTAGSGIVANTVRFDGSTAAGFTTVLGGTTAVGQAIDRVGGAGIFFTNVLGDLSFTDLDVFSGNGAGLKATSTGTFNGGAGSGFRIAVASGVASIVTDGGPAVDLATVTGALPFASVTTTSSSTTGIALNSFIGSFSAGGALSGISSAAGTTFQVDSSVATITFSGTINSTVGKGIDLTNNTGSTIAFTGPLTISSGASSAFNATGGGTVTATNTANAITTTSGIAVNIGSTTIGAAGVTFQSIGKNGNNSAIILASTGSGPFSVTGLGSTVASGGTIQNIVGSDAISLNNVGGLVTLKNMVIQDISSSTDASDGNDTHSGVDAIHGRSVLGGMTLDNVTIQRISDSAINGTVDAVPVTGSSTPTVWNGLTITNSTFSFTNRFNVANHGDGNNEGAVYILGIKGTVSVTGTTFSNDANGLVLWTDTTGSLDLTVRSNTFSNLYKEVGTLSLGNYGIDVVQQGSLSSLIRIGDTVSESNAALGNAFTNGGDRAAIRLITNTGSNGSMRSSVARNTFTVNDHSSPGLPAGSTAYNFPQSGVLLRAMGTGAYDAIFAGNSMTECMNADGGLGNLSIILEKAASQVIVRNNTFALPWDAPIELRADGQSGGQTSARVLFTGNAYPDGTVGNGTTDLGGPSPYLPFYVQVRNNGRLDLTMQNEQPFGLHDTSSGFANSYHAQTTSAGDILNLFLRNTASPRGYQLKAAVGTTYNLFRNGSAAGTAQGVLQDNINTGGGGVDSTTPPVVNLSGAGTVNLSTIAPSQPTNVAP